MELAGQLAPEEFSNLLKTFSMTSGPPSFGDSRSS